MNPAPAPEVDSAVDQYCPNKARVGIGICLSGGGFRAALFHLGALRRLHELGVLDQITTFSSVSGGSIIAAHLATLPRPITDWEAQVSAPFRSLTARNLRTPAILRRWLPWNWWRASTGVRALAEQYRKWLTSKALQQLPDSTRFIFCSTDLAFGVNWLFERARMGDYQVGYAETQGTLIAEAVAASSCFPPVFNPLPMKIDGQHFDGGKARGATRSGAVSDLRLSDGGVYDNLGLEPVWKDHAYVLVSDGGAIFDAQADRGLFSRLGRYISITENQSLALRKRWLISNFISGSLKGTYWGIGSSRSRYGMPGGYSKDLARGVIARVRTDLDAFSEVEAETLENHGYMLADAAVSRHVPELRRATPDLAPPHGSLMKEEDVRSALGESGKRSLLGRW